MLLHYQCMSINVERQFLAVDGDEDCAGDIVGDLVCNLLTECVHVVVSEVVVGVVQTRDDQTTPRHLTLNLYKLLSQISTQQFLNVLYLSQCHLHHGGQGCVDVQHGDTVHVLHGVAAASNLQHRR